MPKIVDYPRGSLKNCLELAAAIEGMGGGCTIETAAESQNKRPSGAFRAMVGAAGRYGLIESSKGVLSTSQLYKDYRLAYTEEEAKRRLREVFLNPPLFLSIYERFKGKELPVGHFEKLLIREFQVPVNMASRVMKYFVDGGRQCGILDSDFVLLDGVHEAGAEEENENASVAPLQEKAKRVQRSHITEYAKEKSMSGLTSKDDSAYSIRITGPGIDSTMVIHEEDDLLIVQAMLKKVKGKIATAKVSHDEDSSDSYNDDELGL